MINNVVSGQVDSMSGYALVATPNMCIAWNYARVSYLVRAFDIITD